MAGESAVRRRTLAPFELLRRGQDVIRREAEALQTLADKLPVGFVEGPRSARRLPGLRGGRRHRQGRADRSEDLGHARLDRRPQLLPASRRSRARRSRPRPSQRPLPRSVIFRRDRRTTQAVALARKARRARHRHDGPARRARSVKPRRWCCRSAQCVKPARWAWLPSTSTTVMLALGRRAWRLVSSERRGIIPEDFARWHPGGSLGKKLSIVDDEMRPIEQCRVAPSNAKLRDVFAELARPGRRTEPSC